MLQSHLIVKNKAYEAQIKHQFEGISCNLISRNEKKQGVYQLNGGFLFLGLIIGMVLLIGTVLMIYYKQVTEGYEDHENYQMMKKVGLPEDLIKQTIHKQTFWLYALPIIVAVIHGLVASKIIFGLLRMFGIKDFSLFITSYIPVIVVFALIYYIVYKITSRVYYHIVN